MTPALLILMPMLWPSILENSLSQQFQEMDIIMSILQIRKNCLDWKPHEGRVKAADSLPVCLYPALGLKLQEERIGLDGWTATVEGWRDGCVDGYL